MRFLEYLRQFKWFLTLAETKPIIFAIAILIIIVAMMGYTVRYQETKIIGCEASRIVMEERHQRKMDSLYVEYKLKEQELAREVKYLYNTMLEDYKNQLNSQKAIGKQADSLFKKNDKLVQSVSINN